MIHERKKERKKEETKQTIISQKENERKIEWCVVILINKFIKRKMRIVLQSQLLNDVHWIIIVLFLCTFSMHTL